MALNINGTTGISGVDGSVSAPALTGTDSNTGITFPSADTIKLSTAGVERMSITNNGVSATGHILQIVSTTKTDFASQSLTGSGNFFDISGMSVAITPSSASNKVFVMTTVAVANNDGNTNTFIQLRRDSTDIAKGTGGGTTNGSFFLKTRDNFSPHNITVQFLDSPSTTSAVTYKVRWSGENGDVFYLNRNASNTNEGMISTITVMEVAA